MQLNYFLKMCCFVSNKNYNLVCLLMFMTHGNNIINNVSAILILLSLTLIMLLILNLSQWQFILPLNLIIKN